jgi:ABC-type multidrug transport system fused ATPase/permease subunit
MSDNALRALVSALLVVSAALFAVGVAIERHDTRNENRGAAHATLSGVLVIADADHNPSEHPLGGQSSSPGRQGESHAGKEPAAGRAGETSTERKGETAGAGGHESAAQLAREHGNESVFGINTESTALVAIAIVVSIAFAISLWWGPGLIIAGFALAAAVFDVREVFHQIDESRTNLIVIAALVAFLHALVAAGALVLAHRHATDRRITPLGRFSRA